jgi:hypothetical protein
MSPSTSIGIATDYGLYGQGSIPGVTRDCSLLYVVQAGSGTHPISYAKSTVAISPGESVPPHLHR